MSPREGAETSVLFPEAMSRESLNSHPMGYRIPREQWRLRCRRALRLCSIDGFGMREDGTGPIGRERCCSLATVTAGVHPRDERTVSHCMERSDPIRRQLLGAKTVQSETSLPTEEHVPLHAWMMKHLGDKSVVDKYRRIIGLSLHLPSSFPQESGDRIGNRISYRLRYPLS